MKAPATQPLLFEIGCEEIPARFVDAAREDLWRSLTEALAAARLLPKESPPALRFSTPRRLTVWVPNVFVKQRDQVDEIPGPPVKVSFDNKGRPTKAAESFAAKNGVKVAALVRITTPKGEYLAARKTVRGQHAHKLLPALLSGVVAGMSVIDFLRFTIGLPPTNCQRYRSNDPNSFRTSRKALAFMMVAAIFNRFRTMPSLASNSRTLRASYRAISFASKLSKALL